MKKSYNIKSLSSLGMALLVLVVASFPTTADASSFNYGFSWMGSLLANVIAVGCTGTQIAGPDGRCSPKCHGPLAPPGCKASSIVTCKQLANSQQDYEDCMQKMSDAGISTSDGSSSSSSSSSSDGSSYSDSSSASYDSSSWGGSGVHDTHSSRRFNWLPYIIAATVATVLAALWVWKKRRDDALKKKALEDELNSDSNLHGALAKRAADPYSVPLDRTGTGTSFISTNSTERPTTYAMAMV